MSAHPNPSRRVLRPLRSISLGLVDQGNMAISRENRGLTLADVKRSLTLKNLREWLPGFPIVRWAPKYSLFDLQSDITAGLTVGLMVVPQAIAYAGIAGLPHQYGLYSAFMGCIAYTFVGSAKDVTLGPTAIMSLMVNSVADPSRYGANYAVALTLICGLMQLVMSMFRLGALMSFISAPVVSGFTSAAAITIGMGQVKHIFGIHRKVPRAFTKCVKGTVLGVVHGDIKWGDFTMGVICIVLVRLMKIMKTMVVKWDDDNGIYPPRTHVKVARKIMWVVLTGRNALIVLVAALIAYALKSQNKAYLTLAGTMPQGFPHVGPPQFSASWPINGTTFKSCHESIPLAPSCVLANRTGLPDILADFDVGLISVPLIGLLELVAIAQAFARQNNYVVDPNQELFAIGVANVLSSFFSSYPVTGSFSRTAVNAQSGVRTPAAGMVTAGVVILAVVVLTPLFQYIPMAALAAIIISAVSDMVDFKILRSLWRIKVVDLLPLLVAFFGTLFLGIEYGVLLAVVVNIMYLLYLQARPHYTWKAAGDVVTLRLNGGLDFPAISFLRQVMADIQLEMENEEQALSAIVVDWTCIMDVDFTVVLTLGTLQEELKRKDILLLHAAMEEPVERVMRAGNTELRAYASAREAASQYRIVNLAATSALNGEKDPLLASSTRTASVNVDDGL